MTHLPRWLLLVGVVPACTRGGGSPSPPDTDAETATDPCPTGQVLDGDTCVPEACGVGPWGDLPVDGDTVYVDATAASGGDGTQAAPFSTIQAGADAAGGRDGGLVAVAAGTYVENLELGEAHDGVTLGGRCAEMVVVDGSGREAPAVAVTERRIDVGLRGLTVTGGYPGLDIDGARVSVTGTRFVENTWMGVFVHGNGELSLLDVDIADTAADRGDLGWGLDGEDGATINAQDVRVIGNVEIGIALDGGTVSATLLDVTVTDTSTTRAGVHGRGVNVQGGASLVADGLVLEGNHDSGVYASNGGTLVVLTGGSVDGTLPEDSGEPGAGIVVGPGATLEATGTEIGGNQSVGVYAVGAGAEVSLTDVAIRSSTATAGGEWGAGLHVETGASATVVGTTVEDTQGIGIYVSGAGTAATLADVVVRGTATLPVGTFGWGVDVRDGASLTGERVTVAGSSAVAFFAALDGTTVVLEDSDFTDTVGLTDGTGGRGLEVQQGAHLTGTGLRVERNVQDGVLVTAGGVLTLDGCVIRDTLEDPYVGAGWGVSVSDASQATLTDVTFDGNTEVGVSAKDPGTVVTLEGSAVVGTARSSAGADGRGLQVHGGGSLTLDAVTVEGNHDVGFVASGEGTVATIRGSTVRGTVGNLDGSGGRGIWAEAGALVDVRDTDIVGNREAGVAAANVGTRLTLTASEVSDTGRGALTNAATGVVSQDDAWVSGDEVTVRGTEGPGLYAAGATLSCTGCVLSGNGFAGAVVTRFGALTLNGGSVTDNPPDGSLGGGVGVFATARSGPPALTLTGVTIGPHPYAAVWLDGPGAYLLTDDDLSGSEGFLLGGTLVHGNALFARDVPAWDGATGLLLDGDTFHDAGQVAVFLHDASAAFGADTWSGNAEDLLQQHCGAVAALDPTDIAGVGSATICPDGDRLYDFSLAFETLYLPEAETEK